MVDLHVHSSKSDGTFTPAMLVDYAVEKGLSAFALTDHDTVDGLDEALARADELRSSGETGVPEVIPGIEFSTEYEGRDIHIVGLCVDYKKPAFLKPLQAFIDSRTTRNHKMCRNLQEAGIDVTYEKLTERFPDSVITRAHYARYMLENGYIRSMNEAFERYVGDRCPYYVPREKVTPVQAVELVLAAGGIPVLAHPTLYHMSSTRLQALTALLKDAGLMAVECLYPTFTPKEEREMFRLAAKYELLPSGGSDFHGSNKPKLDLGIGYGNLCIPEAILEALKAARQTMLS